MTEKPVRSNQKNLMNILKKCQQQEDQQPAKANPITRPSTSTSSASAKYQSHSVFETSQQEFMSQLNEASQPSVLRPRKRQQQPHKPQKAERKREMEPARDTNIDNVGEAAEWLDKGTKGARDEDDDEGAFQESHEISRPDSTFAPQASVREIMQRKADQIMKGTYKTPRNPTSQDLINKARKLRQTSTMCLKPPGLQPRPIESSEAEIASPTLLGTQNLGVSSSITPLTTAQLHEIQATRSAMVEAPRDEDSDSKWDKINQQTIDQKKKITATIKKDYSKKEIVDHYMELDFDASKRAVEVEMGESAKQQTFMDLIKACMGLAKKAQTKIRFQLISLTKIQMGADEDSYILEVIWKTLKTLKYNRFGMHWQDVGFQGRDPATDLRGTGVLSLFYIYLFIDRHKEDFVKMYMKSVDGQSEFPYAISFVKITGTFVRLLKQNKLPAESLDEYTDWFCAITFNILEKLLKEKLEVTQFGHQMTKMLENIDSHLQKILKTYQTKKTS